MGPLFAASSSDDQADTRYLNRQIGAFRTTEVLGSGGMGTVYLGERTDGQFKQEVAIKVLHTSAMRDRFTQERELLAQLSHPNIAQLLDGGETADGLQYLIMEYVPGLPISDYCFAHVPTIEGRLRLLMEAADAIAYAHQHLIIHRDIKPSNLLVTEGGRLRLLDFGIAKLVQPSAMPESTLTQHGLAPMTPEYAAPEQFRSGRITVATDIYQFGVLMFRVLTGCLPHRGDPTNLIEWGQTVLHDLPIGLSRALSRYTAADGCASAWATPALQKRAKKAMGRDLDAIVGKALAKEPADRYPSMDVVRADLEAYLEGLPVKARRRSRAYVTLRYVQRHSLAMSVAAMALAAIVVVAVVALLQAARAREEAARATASATFLESVITNLAPERATYATTTDMVRAVVDRAAKRLDETTEAEPAVRARLYAAIAYAYNDFEDGDAGAASARKALQILSTQSPDLPLTAHASLALIYALRNQGDEVGAILEVNRLLALLPDDDVAFAKDRISAYGFRASANHFLGKEREALRDVRDAKRIVERFFPEDEGGQLPGMLGIEGVVLRALGRWSEARTVLERGLVISRQRHGDQHPWTYVQVALLSLVLADLGELEAAEWSAVDAMNGLIRVYGAGANNTATAQPALGLGTIMLMQGKADQALIHFETALAAYASAANPKPLNIAYAKESIGRAQLELGNAAEALSFCAEAERINLEVGGSLHPQRGGSLDCLAKAHLLQKELDAAHDAAKTALKLRTQLYGTEHPATLLSEARLLGVEFALGFPIAQTRAKDLALRAAGVFPPKNASYREIDTILAQVNQL